jgi:hypothetical protein
MSAKTRSKTASDTTRQSTSHDPQPELFMSGEPSVTTPTIPQRLVLIDGHALAYRAYFALSRSTGTLANKSGKQTQAVYGFMKVLLRWLR